MGLCSSSIAAPLETDAGGSYSVTVSVHAKIYHRASCSKKRSANGTKAQKPLRPDENERKGIYPTCLYCGPCRQHNIIPYAGRICYQLCYRRLWDILAAWLTKSNPLFITVPIFLLMVTWIDRYRKPFVPKLARVAAVLEIGLMHRFRR